MQSARGCAMPSSAWQIGTTILRGASQHQLHKTLGTFTRALPVENLAFLHPRLQNAKAFSGASISRGLRGHSVEKLKIAPLVVPPFQKKLTTRTVSGSMAENGGTGSTHGGVENKHTNRLASEESPYLLQHAHNPVDWYPWGQEAFAKAQAEDKPIFLSVGYSTCHWCHVMEVESFESEEVAALLNDGFVSIKVDREERPDVDKVYMTYVQATQGGGGWPMSVFLTPSLKPMLGGTYFPPEDLYGRTGFKTLLRRVKEAWQKQRDAIEAGGEEAMRQLAEASESSADSPQLAEGLPEKAIRTCADQLAARYDDKHGGFGDAPKFPRPSEINLLLRRHLRAQQAAGAALARAAERPKAMALFTLERMARGGVHDHVGGGFHRYSVDELWHVPHFEKMLYDQGQLASAYLDAFSLTRDPQHALLARDILDYIRRDLTHPDGGIFSAEDADSLASPSAARKKEGAFYVWTVAEVESVLGSEDAALFAAHYHVLPKGNCHLSPLSDPHKEFAGLNVLIQRRPLADTAARFKLSEHDLEARLGAARQKLHAVRSRRPRPHLDDKVIVAWNGLVISAMARASQVLKAEPADLPFHFPVDGCPPQEFMRAAERAAGFVESKLYDRGANRLRRSFRAKPSQAPGYVDDYAFLIAGLLDLYEAGGSARWLAWALDLQRAQDELFLDKEGGGYYSTPPGDASILLRMKEDYDGAEPSGNSYAAANLLRMAEMLTGGASESLRATAEHTMAVFRDRLAKMPLALPQMCCALDFLSAPAKRQVVIAGAKGAPDTEGLLAAAHALYEPRRVVLHIDEADEEDWTFWQEHNPGALAMAKKGPGGKAAAYICQNFACQAPTSDPARVLALLQELPRGGAKVSSFDLSAAMQGGSK